MIWQWNIDHGQARDISLQFSYSNHWKNKCQTFLDIEPLLTGTDVAAAWGGCCCGCVGIVKDVVGLEGTVGYEETIVC